MTYRDPETGTLYRVLPWCHGCFTVYAERGGQRLKCTDALVSNDRGLVERDLQRAAKRNGWAPVEPGRQPEKRPRCVLCGSRHVTESGDRDWYCHDCHRTFAAEDDGTIGKRRPEYYAEQNERHAKRRTARNRE
jgi:hypothetical protein